MRFDLSPEQFEKLQAALQQAPGVVLTMSGPKQGTLKTPDVTLSCIYDGSFALYVTVEARNSFKARIAPESMIESRVTDMLNSYLSQIK